MKRKKSVVEGFFELLTSPLIFGEIATLLVCIYCIRIFCLPWCKKLVGHRRHSYTQVTIVMRKTLEGTLAFQHFFLRRHICR